MFVARLEQSSAIRLQSVLEWRGASVEDGVLAMPALGRHPTGQSRFPACLAEGAEIYCVSRPPQRVLGLPIARLRARPRGVSPAMRKL